MNYYILSLEIENDEEDAILAGYSEYLDRIRVPFDEGIPLPLADILTPIEILVEINSLRGIMTDNLILDEIDSLIFSEKVVKAFKREGINEIEKLPIILTDSFSNAEEVENEKLKGRKLEFEECVYENYYMVNAISILDCIDHNQSKVDYYIPRTEELEDLPENMKAILKEQEEDKDLDFVYHLVLDQTKIPEDIKIFRLKDCPRILVFKEEVVNAIREAKLTGFVFIPLEEYTDEIPDDDDDDEIEEKTQKEPTPEELKALEIAAIKKQRLDNLNEFKEEVRRRLELKNRR